MIHELKRPIGTLKMCVSGLDNRRMMEDESTKRELISETRNALDNLSAYFSKLRDITFNNVEQIPLNIQIISLRKLFDAVAAGVSVPADKNVSIINDIESDIEVSADRSHLFNILNNLVENAVKYSGTSVEIRAEAAVVNGSVSMHISDNGNGIPSGDLRHIFKRFYRGKASAGEQPGMGLGLAYVRLLTEAHGGEIGVESTEGEGTCFTIRLPQ
ncbi:MAG: HAMP domain-containing histidine kinase, partial [Paramuribaculum sp.]|nr:HAMP domain-containing histidine kinase [Paramuribaculum sp.]